jgi:hypothetical protein
LQPQVADRRLSLCHNGTQVFRIYPMNHDHDEELGMYWYNNDGTRQPEAIRPHRVSVCSSPSRDRKYWEQTFDLTLEYLRLQAGAQFTTMLDAAFIRWLMQTPGEMQRFVLGDDIVRAGQVDWFLTAVISA